MMRSWMSERDEKDVLGCMAVIALWCMLIGMVIGAWLW